MAKFRNVSVKFWSDPFIETLTPDKKLFFLYLITNEHATQCGIYEISFRLMAFETGYKIEAVEKLIEFFESHKKIKYSRKTNEVAIKNFVKHNPQGSPKVRSFVEKELLQVKDRVLIAYIYGTDTVSQVEEELEEEETKEPEKEKEEVADALLLQGELGECWNRWKQHRKEMRKPLTASTLEKQIKFLGGRPPNEAIAIIEQSIFNGWTGLFELKKTTHVNGNTPTRTPQPSTTIIETGKSFGLEKGFSRSGPDGRRN